MTVAFQYGEPLSDVGGRSAVRCDGGVDPRRDRLDDSGDRRHARVAVGQREVLQEQSIQHRDAVEVVATVHHPPRPRVVAEREAQHLGRPVEVVGYHRAAGYHASASPPLRSASF